MAYNSLTTFTFIVVVFVSFTSIEARWKRAVTCGKRLPMTEYFEHGYDLSEFDIFACPKIGGQKAKFIDINVCGKTNKFKLTDDGDEYDVPDQFLRAHSASSSHITSGHRYSNMREISDDLWKPTVFLNYYDRIHGIGKSMFLNGAAYRETQKALANQTKYTVMFYEAHTCAMIVNAGEYEKAHFTPQFVTDTKGLPDKFDGNEKAYLDFLEKYGTHVFLSGTFGAILARWTEYSKGDANVAEKEKAMKKDAYALTGQEKVICEKKEGHRQTLVVKDETHGYFQEVLGGQADVNLYKNRTVPLNSFKTFPALVSAEAQPISRLFEDESEKHKSVEKAIKVYMDKAYIKSQVFVIKVLLDNGKKDSKETSDLLTNAEQSANVYNDDELSKLGNELRDQVNHLKFT